VWPTGIAVHFRSACRGPSERPRRLGQAEAGGVLTGRDPNSCCARAGGRPKMVCMILDNMVILAIIMVYALLQRCIGYFAVLPL
jgi:hypothetical protein